MKLSATGPYQPRRSDRIWCDTHCGICLTHAMGVCMAVLLGLGLLIYSRQT